MPRLNSIGNAVTGVGSGQTAVDGAIPTALVGSGGGGYVWLTDTAIIGQAFIPSLDPDPTHWYIYEVDPYDTAPAATLVVAEGTTYIVAGGDVWTKFLNGSVQTNVVALPTITGAGTGSVDRDGTFAVTTNYATSSGITIYSPTGTVLNQINVTLPYGGMVMRDGLLAYPSSEGWQIFDVDAGGPLKGYVPQVGTTGMIAMRALNGDAVVLEYNGPLTQFTIRKANAGTGLVIATADPSMFNWDATVLPSGIVRMAWSTGAGELPAELVTLDINTATGATIEGTVSGGIIVYAPGPTLEGSRFSMASAAAGYPPYREDVLDPRVKGKMSEPWLAYLRTLNASVAGLETASASSSSVTPIPPAVFDLQALVSTTPISGFPQARVVSDSATIAWDFSVPNSATARTIAQYMPVFVGGLAMQIGDQLMTIFWTPPES